MFYVQWKHSKLIKSKVGFGKDDPYQNLTPTLQYS